MANIFDTSDISQQAGSALTPKAGVTTPSPVKEKSAFAELLGVAEGVLEVGAKLYSSSQERIQTEATNAAVSSFADKQLMVADAVDQGKITSQEARMRMRKNFTEAIADNPALVGELSKLQKDLISTSGLGKVAAEGTDEEQAFRAMEKKAVEGGWIKPNMTPEQRAVAAEGFANYQRAIDDLNILSKKVGLDNARINLESSKQSLATGAITQKSAAMDLAAKERKQASQIALGKVSNEFVEKLKYDFEEIRAMLENGQISNEDAVLQADQIFASLQQVSTQIGGDAGSDYVSNMTAPMKSIYQAYRQQFSGEIDAKIAGDRITKAVALQKQLLLGDEDTARLVAISALLPNANLTTLPAVNAAVTRMLDKNNEVKGKPADVLPDTPQEQQDLTTYLGVVKENMVSIGQAQAADTAAQAEQLHNNVINILRSVDVHSNTVDNPTEFNEVTDFFASPEFGNYTEKHGGVPAEVAQQAASALQKGYTDFVENLIKEEYEEKLVRTSPFIEKGVHPRMPKLKSEEESTKPIKEVVDAEPAHHIVPALSGVGVTFKMDKAQVPVEFRAEVEAQVADLNKKVSPVLNKLVRMGAHLEGHKNYRQVFEANFADMFLGKDEPDLGLPKIPTGEVEGEVFSPFVTPEAAKANANLPDIPVATQVKETGGYGDYNDVLGKRESGGQYNIENRIGYIGKYQWGSLALQDLGMVESGIGSSNRKLNDPSVWKGKFGIKSKEEFLNSPEAQEKVMVEWNKLLDKRMKSSGIEKFVGKEMNGVVLNKDGLRAAMHLLGANTVKRLLKQGDLTASKDANGVTALKYIKLFQ